MKMRENNIIIESGIVHALFSCEDCDMEFQDFKTARRRAYQHAKTKHHKVIGEVGVFYHYDGRIGEE